MVVYPVGRLFLNGHNFKLHEANCLPYSIARQTLENTMKLQDLKVGDKITVYCYGNLVNAKVVQSDGIGVCVSHNPVRWGNTVCFETWVQPSTYLQKKWGGTGKDGKPTNGPETTPGAFYRGEPLKSQITR